MGGCFGCIGRKNPKGENIHLAIKIFQSIDVDGQLKLTSRNLAVYFKEYPESSIKLLMNAMDFDQDQVITKTEWLGYWEYIRRAGYDEVAIKKSLTQIQNGTVFLNFPKAESYKIGVPRQTVISGIINEIKDDGSLPVKLQP